MWLLASRRTVHSPFRPIEARHVSKRQKGGLVNAVLKIGWLCSHGEQIPWWERLGFKTFRPLDHNCSRETDTVYMATVTWHLVACQLSILPTWVTWWRGCVRCRMCWANALIFGKFIMPCRGVLPHFLSDQWFLPFWAPLVTHNSWTLF